MERLNCSGVSLVDQRRALDTLMSLRQSSTWSGKQIHWTPSTRCVPNVGDRLALLADVVEPRGPGQWIARHFLEEMVDALHYDRWLLRGTLLEGAEKVGHAGQLALEDAGDLVALGHDIVEQHFVCGGAGEGLAEQFEVCGRDSHWFVGEDVEARGDGAVDVFGLVGVVAGQHDDIAGFLAQHAVEEIGAGIDFLLPMCGLVRARVEASDAFEVLLQVLSRGRIHVHDRANLRIHELLDQAGVEVAGIEGEEADLVGGAGCAKEMHMARRTSRGEVRSPKSEVRRKAESRRPKGQGRGARGEERIR